MRRSTPVCRRRLEPGIRAPEIPDRPDRRVIPDHAVRRALEAAPVSLGILARRGRRVILAPLADRVR